MAAVLLGQNKPEEPKTEVVKSNSETTHKTAFMVLIDDEGVYSLEPDINAIIVPARKPSAQEIKAALGALLLDIQIQETAMLSANATVSLQMQMAQRMSEQAQNMQIAQMLNKDK